VRVDDLFSWAMKKAGIGVSCDRRNQIGALPMALIRASNVSGNIFLVQVTIIHVQLLGSFYK